MPRILRMPSKAQLPEGPHREFVEELFIHYREAGRPPLRTISAWIKRENEREPGLPGSASPETIRRILQGTTVPRLWPTVETVLFALCALGGRQPDEDRWEDSFNGASESFAEVLKRRWNAMLDDEEALPTLPRPRPEVLPNTSSVMNGDPWNDEPPF